MSSIGSYKTVLNLIHAVRWVLAVGVCLLISAPIWAVEGTQVPDAGALMRGTEQLQQFYNPPPELHLQAKPQLRPKEGQQTFVVKRFRIKGANLVSSKEIESVLKPWLNTEIVFADLEDALQAVADLYQKHGWYARPQLPEQDLVDGEVTIQIIEGKLGEVKVDDSESARISEHRVVRTITARQDLGAPLNLQNLERAVSILNDTPGISATTAMAAGQAAESTDLIIQVKPKRWWGLSSSVDNFGARSTGYGRLSLNGNVDNPLGIGDQITANYVGSLGTQYGRVGYTLPVGYDGWRVGANYSALTYSTLDQLINPVRQFGSAQIFGATATYPILRSAGNNINTAFALDRKRYYNASVNISGEPLENINSINAQPGVSVTTGDKVISVGTWSLNGERYDDYFGGGAIYWGGNLSFGNLDLTSSPAIAVAADQAGLNAAGQYGKLAGNVSRLQQISTSTMLWVSLQGQLASKNLDSSEDFSLGGPQGVRAYPNYEAQGDQGWLSTVELRHSIDQNWQGIAFIDAGGIMINKKPWTGSTQPNTYNLFGAGIGVNYTMPGRMVAKAVVAHRIGVNPGANPATGTDTDGTLSAWRFWLSLSAVF